MGIEAVKESTDGLIQREPKCAKYGELAFRPMKAT